MVQMNLFTKWKQSYRCRKQTYGYWSEGVGRINREAGVDIYTRPYKIDGAFLVAQMVKKLPALQETQVQSLGQEDPLEEKWQAIPIFLPEEFRGQRSLVAPGHGITKSRTKLSDWHTHIKQINNKDLLWSTGNSPQCPAMASGKRI